MSQVLELDHLEEVPTDFQIRIIVFLLPSCLVKQDGRHAAILNDIKNLFDVHNPQTIPDLGVK